MDDQRPHYKTVGNVAPSAGFQGLDSFVLRDSEIGTHTHTQRATMILGPEPKPESRLQFGMLG